MSLGGMEMKQTIVLHLLQLGNGSKLYCYVYWRYEMKANYSIISIAARELK